MSVTWLHSSWSGAIQREALSWVTKYYFEVLSWNAVIKSWFVDNALFTWTQLIWNYIWRIQWIDQFWNKSDFSTGFICSRPSLNYLKFSAYECQTITWELNYLDNCVDDYSTIWQFSWLVSSWVSILNNSWLLTKEVFIKNIFWEESDHILVDYEREDSMPTLSSNFYKYPNIINKSTNIGDIIPIFWVNDGGCWNSAIFARQSQ